MKTILSFRIIRAYIQHSILSMSLIFFIQFCVSASTDFDINKAINNSVSEIDINQYLNRLPSLSDALATSALPEKVAFMPCATTWSLFNNGNGLNDIVKDIAIDSDGRVYAVGSFLGAGGILVNYVAMWNGSNWSALGSSFTNTVGTNGSLEAVEVDQDDIVYVGGTFSNAGGVNARNIARWNGTSWSAMGGSLNNTVYDIEIDIQNRIYVGGSFTGLASGSSLTPINRVGRWSGANWGPLANGTNGTVYSVYSNGQGRVYAGGSFTNAGSTATSNIALYNLNGGTWSALGSVANNGTNNTVRKVILGNSGILAGGEFTMAGGNQALRIAAFNGSSWASVGQGFSDTVYDLAIDQMNDLYAVGAFVNAGGASANRIAKLEGNAWVPIGNTLNNGANQTVYAIEVDQSSILNKIYIGGEFTEIESDPSEFIACFTNADSPPMAACMDITVDLGTGGMASITPTDVDNGSTDDCGIAGMSLDITDFTCAEAGTIVTVTLTIKDTAGQTDMCTAMVSVTDTQGACANSCNPDMTAPVAVCMDISVALNTSGMVSIVAADVNGGSTDNCGITALDIDIMNFTCADLAPPTVAVTLTVKDAAGFSDMCTAMVTVTDPSGTCIDACNPDATDPIAVCKNAIVSLDASGMASITTADIDNGSMDACSNVDLSLNIMNFDCSNTGSGSPTTVTMTVTDIIGNMATCTATVTVNDPLFTCCNMMPNMPPSVTCVNSTTVAIGSGGTIGSVTITPQMIGTGGGDDCGIVDAYLNMDTFTCANIGPNTVTLTVEDAGGLTASCTATVNVGDPNGQCNCNFDMTPPVAICFPNITVDLDQDGMYTLDVTQIDNGSFDTCSPVQLGLSPSATLTCADAPGAVVTLKVIDASNNNSSCTTQVEINDPFGACCPSVLYVDDDPIPSGLYRASNNVYSDKTVPASNVVDFRAGQQVNLIPGFETISGATFHAYISPCN